MMERLVLEREYLSDSESNGYEEEEPKKRNRITWNIELHEKFLEAVEALGGNEYATPEGILHLMNVKGLTAKHISSHLQKHRLRHRNAKQGGQRQENASRRPAHDEATVESITPRVETYRKVYPLRLWTEVKKNSADTAALKPDNYREDTESLCVWDKYENNLHGVFSEKKKRWQFMSKHHKPGKNNIVITDEGDPNEAPKTAGGAYIDISGSSSSMGENNHSEAARANDNVGNISLREAFRAYLGTSGSGSLLTNDQVRQNSYAEATRDMGSINLTQDPVYNASTDFSVAWAHVESNGLDLTGPSDGREVADSFRMNQWERSQDHQSLGPEDFLQVGDNADNDALRSVGPINIDEPVTQESQEQQNLGMEDLLQVDDIAWDDALTYLLDEPMIEEATVGGSQDQQSLAPEALQAGNNAWDNDLRSAGMVNLLDEPIAQGAAFVDALSPIAQDDVLWAWSSAAPAE